MCDALRSEHSGEEVVMDQIHNAEAQEIQPSIFPFTHLHAHSVIEWHLE